MKPKLFGLIEKLQVRTFLRVCTDYSLGMYNPYLVSIHFQFHIFQKT